MIKVFHVVTSLDLGGAERVAFNIAKSKSPNYEVVHSDSQFSHLVIDELEREGVRLHFSPIRNKKLGILLFWLWFIHIYIKYRPNIIHSHTEIPDMALWLFRKIACLFFWIKQDIFVRFIIPSCGMNGEKLVLWLSLIILTIIPIMQFLYLPNCFMKINMEQ